MGELLTPAVIGAGLTAWELAQRISPRAHVQAAATTATGEVLPHNTYPRRVNIAGPDPLVPFVVPLADEEGAFHLIGFDFDAHNSPAEQAHHDAYALVAVLERLGDLPYLVCESGPSGGLHVWLAAAEPIPANVVATLARAAARSYPTLGIEPLLNPTTGGLRPPGSPHRHGGRSTITFGDVSVLLQPATTLPALRRLIGALDSTQPATPFAEGLALVDGRGGEPERTSDGRHVPGGGSRRARRRPCDLRRAGPAPSRLRPACRGWSAPRPFVQGQQSTVIRSWAMA